MSNEKTLDHRADLKLKLNLQYRKGKNLMKMQSVSNPAKTGKIIMSLQYAPVISVPLGHTV